MTSSTAAAGEDADRNLASALLRDGDRRGAVVISNDVKKVALRAGTPQQGRVDRLTLAQVRT